MQNFTNLGVCKVFVTIDANSSEKPVIYCRSKSRNQRYERLLAFPGYECHWTNTRLVFAMIPRVSVPVRCLTGQGMAGHRDPALQW